MALAVGAPPPKRLSSLPEATSVSDAAIVPASVPAGSQCKLGVEPTSDFLLDCKAAVGADDVAGLRNRLRIQPPCRYIGGGTFGKVYQMSAVPWSAAGEVAPETVAVKVMSKMEETQQEQAQLAKHVRREIDLLTMVLALGGLAALGVHCKRWLPRAIIFPLCAKARARALKARALPRPSSLPPSLFLSLYLSLSLSFSLSLSLSLSDQPVEFVEQKSRTVRTGLVAFVSGSMGLPSASGQGTSSRGKRASRPHSRTRSKNTAITAPSNASGTWFVSNASSGAHIQAIAMEELAIQDDPQGNPAAVEAVALSPEPIVPMHPWSS